MEKKGKKRVGDISECEQTANGQIYLVVIKTAETLDDRTAMSTPRVYCVSKIGGAIFFQFTDGIPKPITPSIQLSVSDLNPTSLTVIFSPISTSSTCAYVFFVGLSANSTSVGRLNPGK